MTDKQFYRVEAQQRPEGECACANCMLWTVVYDDPATGEPTEIGNSYQGEQGFDYAEDVRDLMNMACDQARAPLADALHKLVCEVDALAAFRHEVIEAISQTNWNCIRFRADIARKLLEKMQS